MARSAPVALRPDGTIGCSTDRVGTIGDLLASFRPPSWFLDAACVEHPELDWFSDEPAEQAQARQVCDGCLVRTECAAAGQRRPYGMWGGLTLDDRRRRLRASAS